MITVQISMDKKKKKKKVHSSTGLHWPLVFRDMDSIPRLVGWFNWDNIIARNLPICISYCFYQLSFLMT